jgi:protein SCO1/2
MHKKTVARRLALGLLIVSATAAAALRPAPASAAPAKATPAKAAPVKASAPAKAAPVTPPPASVAGSAGQIWGADYFPDVALVSHEGKTVRFFSDLIKDKVVAINFIYTSCPDTCALETARLREVQEILGDRVGRDVFLYSISIDPKHDTPAVLKRYAEKFEVGAGWLFLTGNEADITLIRKKFGLYSEDSEGEKLKEHQLNHIIGNQKTGQWMKSSPHQNPYVLATQLGSWLHNWKLPPDKKRDYADAPKLRKMSKGESLFRTRCSSCHTIGPPQVKSGKRPIGPDLAGVTRKRDRAWLTRWLAEPDKMLAEKDPLAMALLAQWQDIPMPNLKLSPVDIEELLSHIEGETHRLEHHHGPGGQHQH